ncbi:MAG: PAS domain-containing protein [Myxococcales bacterium]|nr:MAG: PAS domain-containing protein [Myxococcales bacterium]
MSADETAKLKARILQLEDDKGRLLAQIERLEMEKEQPSLNRTIHGLTVMIVQTDAQGRLSYINSAMEELLGIDRKAVLGQPLSVIDQSRLGKGYLQLMYDQAVKSQEEITAEHHYADPKTGKMRYVKVKVTAQPDGAQILIEDQSNFKRLESSFKRYVSPKVIEELLRKDFDFFRPEKYELTVLFADLRGFTRLCTRLTPEEVKRVIDRFLGLMMRVIIDEEATVDKVVGDEVMALFGAPIRYPDHAVRAVNAALKMQEVHQHLIEEWRSSGLENPPALGIGINTGEMIVGNIGSELRMDYTVLGHHVNLGSRLCSAAKGSEVLISPRTFELTKTLLQKNPQAIRHSVKFRSAPELFAKGIDAPIHPISVVRVGV